MKKLCRSILLVTAIAAPATAGTVSAKDPNGVIAALQAEGYRAKLDKDSLGDPMISTAMGGSNTSILFYECTDHKDCKSIQFSSGFDLEKPMDPAQVVKWSQEFRFTHIYIDKEGDPYLRMDVDTHPGGISGELFGNVVGRWEDLLGDFKKFIGF